jgi:hypothetical protein
MRASVWPAAAAPPGPTLPEVGEGGTGVVQGVVRAAVIAAERRDGEVGWFRRGGVAEGFGVAEGLLKWPSAAGSAIIPRSGAAARCILPAERDAASSGRPAENS